MFCIYLVFKKSSICLPLSKVVFKILQLRHDINWDENPDKQILQWGGINVDHQHSRDGGF